MVPTTAWRRIGPVVLGAQEALDRASSLLETLEPGAAPVIAWGVVHPPAVVLGRAAGEPPVDLDRCRAAGLAVVRRSSGGGPVIWDRSLLGADLLIPRGSDLAPDDVIATYRVLGEAIAEGLRSLGVEARSVPVAEARQAPRDAAAAACFGGLSPWEVVGPDGRKVAGLAQVRRRQGVLLQAGVLLHHDAALLAGVLRPVLPATALSARAAGLDEYRAPVTCDHVVEAVERALARREGALFSPVEAHA